MILPEAIERAVVVCKKFSDLPAVQCRGNLFAVATSAYAGCAKTSRRSCIVSGRKPGFDIRVISGQEEATVDIPGCLEGYSPGGKTGIFHRYCGGKPQKLPSAMTAITSILRVLNSGSIRLSNLYGAGL